LEADAFRLAFSAAAAFADALRFAAEFSVSDAVIALLEVFAAVLAVLLVELEAEAGPEVLRELVAVPLLDEVAPPLVPLLV
jgi:hypothetical protein